MQRRMFLLKRFLGVTTGRSAFIGALLALTLVVPTLAAPPLIGPAWRDRGPFPACPAPLPVADVQPGMRGTGFTVHRGSTPDRFAVKVLGVLTDGIAPGLDMIIVETDSRALRRAKGIWAGMSGSPVYARDGRLIGAVAYGFTAGPSRIAGLTAAEGMLAVLDYGGTQADAAPLPPARETVYLPPDLKAAVAAHSDATAAQLDQGFTQLQVPLGVGGLDQHRLARFTEQLSERLPGRFIPYLSTSAPITPPAQDPATIVPGGNFAAALSYGDLTVGGIGTTTVVCDNGALAFGHPLTFRGAVALSAHRADAITIVADPTLSPFKLANIGSTVGTLDQDRLAAIRAQLGAPPAGIAVSSVVTGTDTGRTRAGTTQVNADEDLPSFAPFHLVANLDRVLDRIGEGTALVRWTATGRTAAGQPWTLTRENRFASRFDITFESIIEQLTMLQVLEQNTFEEVQFKHVIMSATIGGAYRAYQFGPLQLRQPNGEYATVNPQQPIIVDPGTTIDARVQLVPYQGQGTQTWVAFRLHVPVDQAGTQGTLDISGGQPFVGVPGNAVTSFPALLEALQTAPRNDEVRATLTFPGMDSTPVAVDRFRQPVDQVTSGNIAIAVLVNP